MTLPHLDSAPAAAPPVAYLAARSRAHGPTAPLWHAVQLNRPFAGILGACELSLCGSLVRIMAYVPWPTAVRDVCPACITLAR